MWAKYPYTNFQDLNLDQILELCRQLQHDMPELSAEFERLRQYVEGLDLSGYVDDKINRMVADGTFAELINQDALNALTDKISAARREYVLFIGDSYGEGYTPGDPVTPWPTLVANALGLPSGNWVNVSSGGKGFTTGSVTFTEMLTGAMLPANLSQRCGLIVVGGGYNDKGASYDQIAAGVERFVAAAKQRCPKATIVLAPFGWAIPGLATGIHASVTWSQLRNMVLYWQQAAVAKGAGYIPYVYTAMHNNNYFSSDYVHPNANGQYSIARFIQNWIVTGGGDPSLYSNSSNLQANFQAATGMTVNLAGNVTVNGGSTTVNITNLTCNVSSPTSHTYTGSAATINLGKLRHAAVFGQSYDVTIPVHGYMQASSNKYYDFDGTLIVGGGDLLLSISKINASNDNYFTDTIKYYNVGCNHAQATVHSLLQ